VGLQVPAQDDKAFDQFLEALGYPYAEETHNPVYRLFLRA
jgi:threonine dehydratase